MKNRLRVFALLGVASVGLGVLACQDRTPTAVAPQVSLVDAGDNDGLFRACYIPGSGMMYRVSADGVEGLREECRANKHVEFSWPAVTPLVGQRCPEGQLMTGMSAEGTLLCAEPTAD